MITPPRFTADDAHRAYDEWGANCGPGAIAAICDLTLDELRPHMGDFESKRYTNPKLMGQVLRSVGAHFSFRVGRLGRTSWPRYGLARIQWHGPWMADGVPQRVRYRHTHWVGAARSPDKGIGIFDINAIGNGTGWCSLEDWSAILVPWLLEECVPRASGEWSITHAVEVVRSGSAE